MLKHLTIEEQHIVKELGVHDDSDPVAIFAALLRWEGIEEYKDPIIRWIQAIYNIDLYPRKASSRHKAREEI